MAKSTGLAMTTLSIDDSAGSPQAIINDFVSWDMSFPRGVQDVSGVDKSAIERLLLLADANLNLSGVFNPSANRAHAVFRTVPSTSVNRTVSWAHLAQTIAMEMLFTDYQISRPQSGEMTFTAPGVLADGTVPTFGP
jgi:hypothetical protein